jgi:hypothetical protein
MKLNKEKIIKEDGRYLIFYEFDMKDTDNSDQKSLKSEAPGSKQTERTTKNV